MKEHKEGKDFKEIDLLARQSERHARIGKFNNGGNEADLNLTSPTVTKARAVSRKRTFSPMNRLRSWKKSSIPPCSTTSATGGKTTSISSSQNGIKTRVIQYRRTCFCHPVALPPDQPASEVHGKPDAPEYQRSGIAEHDAETPGHSRIQRYHAEIYPFPC